MNCLKIYNHLRNVFLFTNVLIQITMYLCVRWECAWQDHRIQRMSSIEAVLLIKLKYVYQWTIILFRCDHNVCNSDLTMSELQNVLNRYYDLSLLYKISGYLNFSTEIIMNSTSSLAKSSGIKVQYTCTMMKLGLYWRSSHILKDIMRRCFCCTYDFWRWFQFIWRIKFSLLLMFHPRNKRFSFSIRCLSILKMIYGYHNWCFSLIFKDF
jgi:hypothetical protein